MTRQDPDRQARQLRAIVATIGVAGISLVTLVQLEDFVGAWFPILTVVLWGLIPFGLYFGIVRSLTGSLWIGLGLLMVTAWSQLSIFTNQNSTAGIGFMMYPILIILLTAVAGAMDTARQDSHTRTE